MKIKTLLALLFVALVAASFSLVTGWNPAVIACTLFLMSFIPQPKGVTLMAVTKEIWTKDIIDNLFKNNAFAVRAYNADQYVLSGKVVHIPRAGAPSQIKKNLDTFPATAVKRGDDDITYNIDTFYSIPRHIEEIEKYELSYDKRQSAMGEDEAALIETAMDGLLYNWGPVTAQTILTDGEDVAATLSGATGQRKAFTKAALQSAKLKMDKDKIPTGGRVALLTADHYNQFFNSLSDAEKTNFNRIGDLAEGTMGRYLGFDVMMRSSVLRYRGADNAVTKVDEYADAFAASDKTGDRAASLIYHDKSVERAFGNTKMFDRSDDPTYYGDVYSFILRMGGRIRRVPGVYAAVEAIAA